MPAEPQTQHYPTTKRILIAEKMHGFSKYSLRKVKSQCEQVDSSLSKNQALIS